MLSKEEIERYDRHILLKEIGKEGQEKLKQAKVLVVGAGGLGCPALQYLTAAGVGTIGAADFDVIDASNLQRQILYGQSDIGKSKVETAVNNLRDHNSFVAFMIHKVKLTRENVLQIFPLYDIIIDGSDNFETRYLVNDACIILGKPLVFGSIFKFEGQATVFNYKNGPTYRCLFPEPPKAGEVPNCSQIGVLGVLPGIIGTLQASECIKIILGLGEVLSGKLFTIDMLTMQTRTYNFQKIEANTKITELIDYESFCGLNNKEVIKEIEVKDLYKMITNKEEFQLIDVRSEEEFRLCNLGGELLPLNTIESMANAIEKTKKVIIHCHHGGRSAQAIQILQEKFSYTNLYNLKGGIHQWALEIDNDIVTY